MGNYDDGQMAIAVTTAAAELARTAQSAPSAVYRNLDAFATAVSGRGVGFCGPQLMAPVPWFANIAVRNGVMFDFADQMVRRRG